MPILRYLSRAEAAKAAAMPEALECVERMFRLIARGEATEWPPVSHSFDGGRADMELRSGLADGMFGHKTVTRITGGRHRGLPDRPGLIVVYSGENGLPLGVTEASYITALRVGAECAVGARALAREGAESALIVGTGSQALFQAAAALSAMPGLRRLTVADPRKAVAAVRFVETLPGRLRAMFGLETAEMTITAAESLPRALEESDVVFTVTEPKTPVIHGEWVRPGTHFSCAGADRPGKQELDFLPRSRVFVDDPERCALVGEVASPLRQGAMTRHDVAGTIGQVLLGNERRESREEITVFDCAGTSLLDLAVARRVLEAAGERGLGTELEL